MTTPGMISAGRGRYALAKWRFFLADAILGLAVLAFFQFFLARVLYLPIVSLTSNYALRAFLFGTILWAFLYVVMFPIKVAESFLLERGFGLSTQTFKAWAADEAKGTALSFLLWTASVIIFYVLLRVLPVLWWVAAATLWVVFSIVLARLFPLIIIPIFFKYMPIGDADLKKGIVELSDKAGIKLMDVCEIDLSRKSNKANAALIGLGKSRKVIMADTLVRKFTRPEAMTVVAHEFGHHRFGHIWMLLGASAFLTYAAFFLVNVLSPRIAAAVGSDGIQDIYMLPALVLLASAAGLMVSPFINWFSRALERQADRYAIELTEEPEVFVSVMKKLASMNQAEPDPPLVRKIMIYDHPPISERIRMAEGMMKPGRLISS
ncbi:MAG: M48 family metallopeptidase [Candidatus Omnitrophica bacterium]|nr:M48 family metallopeptidase [Candidatus Omnitrophota bacterium]